MTEGKDYIITSDPYSCKQDDWAVILKYPFDRVVGRYRNISITEKGTKVSFDFEPLYCPETANVKGNEEKFNKFLGEVLSDILKQHHDKGANIYYSMKTGEKIEY